MRRFHPPMRAFTCLSRMSVVGGRACCLCRKGGAPCAQLASKLMQALDNLAHSAEDRSWLLRSSQVCEALAATGGPPPSHANFPNGT